MIISNKVIIDIKMNIVLNFQYVIYQLKFYIIKLEQLINLSITIIVIIIIIIIYYYLIIIYKII